MAAWTKELKDFGSVPEAIAALDGWRVDHEDGTIDYATVQPQDDGTFKVNAFRTNEAKGEQIYLVGALTDDKLSLTAHSDYPAADCDGLAAAIQEHIGDDSAPSVPRREPTRKAK